MKAGSTPASASARPATAPPNPGSRAGQRHAKQLQAELALATEKHGRVGLVLLDIPDCYAARAAQRLGDVAEACLRTRCGHVAIAALAPGRFALLIAPVGSRAHLAALAEEFVRRLDPRLNPLLRRALPFAYQGVGLWPEDGSRVDDLLARAEHALKTQRSSLTPARQGRAAHQLARPPRKSAARLPAERLDKLGVA